MELYDSPRKTAAAVGSDSSLSKSPSRERPEEHFDYDVPPSNAVVVTVQVEEPPLQTGTELYDQPPSVSRPVVPPLSPSDPNLLHYTVKSPATGTNQVYAKMRKKQTPPPKTLEVPPELPPRNTPVSSPRQSAVVVDNETDYNVPRKSAASIDQETEYNVPKLRASQVSQGLQPNGDEKSGDVCVRCKDPLKSATEIVKSNGELYHRHCFVCAQCFRPFGNDLYYEVDKRKYCQHDFRVLYSPCCHKCREFVDGDSSDGTVVKALSMAWHMDCFRCEMCDEPLTQKSNGKDSENRESPGKGKSNPGSGMGFVKRAGRILCRKCNLKVKAEIVAKRVCNKCHDIIDGDPLRFRGDVYHPYHFNCTSCGNELTSTAREVRARPGFTANDLNELYCLRCHDKMGIPICGACRRPIEERVVTALGKTWHVEHFVCAHCEKPFLGSHHFERKGLAYCETHYHMLFGDLCHVCNQVIHGDVFRALNKAWCAHHFACSACDRKFPTQKTKFHDVDLKPVCKACFKKFPRNCQRIIEKYHKQEDARNKVPSSPTK